MVRVRLRGWVIHSANESPHKNSSTRVCVCVCVNEQQCLAAADESTATGWHISHGGDKWELKLHCANTQGMKGKRMKTGNRRPPVTPKQH